MTSPGVSSANDDVGADRTGSGGNGPPARVGGSTGKTTACPPLSVDPLVSGAWNSTNQIPKATIPATATAKASQERLDPRRFLSMIAMPPALVVDRMLFAIERATAYCFGNQSWSGQSLRATTRVAPTG